MTAEQRRNRHREDMIRHILVEAEALVADEGIDRLSMRRLAGRLGYSHAALYEYVDSREMIIQQMVFHGANGMEAMIREQITRAGTAPTALDGMLPIANAYRAWALANPDLYRLAVGGRRIADLDQAFATSTALSEGFAPILALWQRGIDEGDLKPFPPAFMMLTMWTSLHGFVSFELGGHLDIASSWLHDGEPTEVGAPKLFDQVLGFIFQSFLTPQGQSHLADMMTTTETDDV